MRYRIEDEFNGEVLADVESYSPLGALSDWAEPQGFARLDDMTDEEQSELGVSWSTDGGQVSADFTNTRVLAYEV